MAYAATRVWYIAMPAWYQMNVQVWYSLASCRTNVYANVPAVWWRFQTALQKCFYFLGERYQRMLLFYSRFEPSGYNTMRNQQGMPVRHWETIQNSERQRVAGKPLMRRNL